MATLDELHGLSANQNITVSGKVSKVGDTTEITSKNTSKHLMKQDCSLKDCKGSVRIVLWENDIGKLTEDTSYKLENVLLREYGGTKYLSVSENTIITEVSDIGDIIDSDSEDEQIEGRKCIEGEITAISNTTEYYSCINCNAKVNSVNELIGECSKCGAIIKLH